MNTKGFPPLLLACLCLVVLLSTACGYHLAADTPTILGDGSKTLKVKGVDHPTLHEWLPYNIRSALRDEIGARHLAQWVDSGPADYEIQIKVLSYTSREWGRTTIDQSLLYATTISIEAIIYKGDTNTEIWRSGVLSYYDNLDKPGEKVAATEFITQIVRLLADKLRSTF